MCKKGIEFIFKRWIRKYLQRSKWRMNLATNLLHYLLSNTNLSLSFLFKLKFCWLQNQDLLCFHTEIDTLTSPSWWKCVKICLQGCRITVQLRDADHHHHHSRRIHLIKQSVELCDVMNYGKILLLLWSLSSQGWLRGIQRTANQIWKVWY